MCAFIGLHWLIQWDIKYFVYLFYDKEDFEMFVSKINAGRNKYFLTIVDDDMYMPTYHLCLECLTVQNVFT